MRRIYSYIGTYNRVMKLSLAAQTLLLKMTQTLKQSRQENSLLTHIYMYYRPTFHKYSFAQCCLQISDEGIAA